MFQNNKNDLSFSTLILSRSIRAYTQCHEGAFPQVIHYAYETEEGTSETAQLKISMQMNESCMDGQSWNSTTSFEIQFEMFSCCSSCECRIPRIQRRKVF